MTHRLVIRVNNSATNDPCAICGERTDPTIGPDLFLADTWSPVCEQCGMANEPQLVRALERYWLGYKPEDSDEALAVWK